MNWLMLNRNNIFSIETGIVIELLEGTWDCPIEIQPHSVPGINPIQEVKQIRIGVRAAQKIYG